MIKKDRAIMFFALLLTFGGMIYYGDFDDIIKARKPKADEIVKEYFDNQPGELNGLKGEGEALPKRDQSPETHDYWIRFQIAHQPVLKSASEYSSTNSNVIKSSDFFLVRCPDDVDSLKDSTELSYVSRRNGEESVDYLLRNKRTGVCFFRSCLGTANRD